MTEVNPSGLDILVLKMIDERASISEISTATSKSLGWVHKRLRIYERDDVAWITPPPHHKQARSRNLTRTGREVLRKYYGVGATPKEETE